MFNEKMLQLGKERSAIRALFEYGNARAKQIGAENVFDFSLGNPSEPAPACVQKEIERLLQNTPAQVLHGYTSAAGDPAVRERVSEYINGAFGVPMSEHYVYMTCGAAASLTITLSALCVQGDEFIVLAPFFPEYKVFAESAGGKLVVVPPTSDFRLNVQAIENAITPKTKAMIINSPNNPTGVVYAESEIKALAALLNRVSEQRGAPVYLISDEPYRELAYGVSVPYIAKYYQDTITCYSFSKSLSLAGERIGYISIADNSANAGELFSAVCGAGRSLGYVCAPSLFQRVCAACLGKCSDLSVYSRNRALLYDGLTKMSYECVKPEGAFYLFVKSPVPNAGEFCARAKEHELLIVPSDSFGVGGYARVSYCVPEERIIKALPAFESLMSEFK